MYDMKKAYTQTLHQLISLAEKDNPYWNIDAHTAQYLKKIITDNSYTQALEIGTSNGLSALQLAAALEKTDGHLTTVESHAQRFALAKENFMTAEATEKITQIKGHAPEILETIPGQFDFIFIDATSIEYKQYYTHLKNRLVTGGTLVADNIISHQAKVQDFIDAIKKDTDFTVSIQNIGKGVLIAKKI